MSCVKNAADISGCSRACAWLPGPAAPVSPTAATPSASLSRKSGGSRSPPRARPRGRGEVEQRRGQPGPPGAFTKPGRGCDEKPGPADRQTACPLAVTFQTPKTLQSPCTAAHRSAAGLEESSRAPGAHGGSGEQGGTERAGQARSPQGLSAPGATCIAHSVRFVLTILK